MLRSFDTQSRHGYRVQALPFSAAGIYTSFHHLSTNTASGDPARSPYSKVKNVERELIVIKHAHREWLSTCQTAG